jgi:hypothetical protein
MKATIEERTYRELPPELALAPSDDAWHLLKDRTYIEWWYFDVMNVDGSIVRGQFFISRDLLRPGFLRNGVRATHVKNDGTEITVDKRFPPASFKSSAESCEVEIEQNYLRGSAALCQVHVEDEDTVLDLEFTSGIEGFKSHANFGGETKFMRWVVPQPRGHAHGTFRHGKETHQIDGIGYRDHNWLNFPPIDAIEYWDWGRVYDDEYTIIFADIFTTKRLGSTEMKPLLVFDSSKLVYMTTEPAMWSLGKTGTRLDPSTKTESPETHRLVVSDDDLSLEIDLRLERVFQRIDPLSDFNPVLRWLIRTFKGKPAITSYHSVGSGQLALGGQSQALGCTAVHEYVTNV